MRQKDKADAAELTLKTVKKETKDVMGKQFKKLQKRYIRMIQDYFGIVF